MQKQSIIAIIAFNIIALLRILSTACYMSCPETILFKEDYIILFILFIIVPIFLIRKGIGIISYFIIVGLIYFFVPSIIANISEMTNTATPLTFVTNIDNIAYQIAKNNNDHKDCEYIVGQSPRIKCFHEIDPEYPKYETNCYLYEKSFVNIKDDYQKEVISNNEEYNQIYCFTNLIYLNLKDKKEINCNNTIDSFRNSKKFYQIENLCKTAKKFQESVNSNNCGYFTNIKIT